jgi:hypothetical protein
MLSFDFYAVVKNGMYLSIDPDNHEYFFCYDIAVARFLNTQEYAEILATEYAGTVHQVTIVSVPLPSAVE